MKRKLTLVSVAIVLAMPLTAYAGGETQQQEVTFEGGYFEGQSTTLAQCIEAQELCDDKLGECTESLDAIKAIPGCDPKNPKKAVKEKACKNKYDDDGDGLTDCEDPDCMHKKVCQAGYKPKKKTCYDGPLNGMVGYWYGLHKMCGIEAAMDGSCMTMKESYGAVMCLYDELSELRKELAEMDKTEADPVDTSQFATRQELQAQVDNWMAWVQAIKTANEERDKKFEGLAEELKKLAAELEKTKELALKHEACLFPEKHLEYYDTDVYGRITAESYREVCGVLADIPLLKGRLDELEKCLKTKDQFANEDLFLKNCKQFDAIVEIHNLLKPIVLCNNILDPYWDSPEEWAKACPFYQDRLCNKADAEEQMLAVDGDKEVLERACDVEAHAFHDYENAIKPIAHCFVTFRGDAFCGGGLSWVALAIRKDDIKAVDFSVFLAALAGVGGDANHGLAYGGKVTFFPGKQDIIGIFIGYEGVSSGIFEEEYAGEPDPDRQDHALLGGLTFEKMWTISDDDGKLIKGGVSCSAGVGAGWQDDSSGSGWNGIFAGDCGAEFSFQW